MRSKAYCLFVLLTSVVFDLVNANTCQIVKTEKAQDCADATLSMTDVKWSFETAFNERKHIPTQNKKFVEVDFNRALLVMKGGDPFDAKQVTFFTDKKENCKKIYFREGPPNAKSVTLKEFASDSKITHSLNGETFVAVFEPECRLQAEISTEPLSKYVVKHQFARNVKSETLEEFFWKGNNGITKELGNYIVASRDDEGNVDPQIKEFNNFFPFLHRNQTGTRHRCHHLCQKGHLFEFKTAFGLPFANTFKVNTKCKWMTIFLNNEPENKMAGAEISFRHGFVTLPMEVKAFPMDFETYGDAKDSAYTVTVMYYQNNKVPQLTITNSHGQAVKSKAVMPSTPQIYFEFDSEECLASVIGQEMITEGGKLVMKEHDFLNNLNLGFMVSRYTNFEGYGYNAVQEPDKNKFDTKEAWVKKPYCAECGDEQPPDDQGTKPESKVPSFTDPPPVVNPDLTPQPPPEDEKGTVFDKKDQEILDNIREQEAIRNAERQSILRSKYYMYWAIPAGFGTGSIASFIICNILMFVMRRSVCTFWYKAMYKRYGSDTTMGAGTTMGKTGGGETIGGGTTAGGTTAGGTTAGETVGSTTAA